MTKITTTRSFDDSQIAGTQAAKDLQPERDYQAQVNENVLRALRNGLSFEDNFNCVVQEIELRHDTPQPIGITKAVSLVFAGYVLDARYRLAEPLQAYYNDQSQLTVVARFTPEPSVAIKVRTVLVFQ